MNFFNSLLNVGAATYQKIKDSLRFVGNKFLEALYFLSGIPERFLSTYMAKAFMSTKLRHENTILIALVYTLLLVLLPTKLQFLLFSAVRFHTLLDLYFNHPLVSNLGLYATFWVLLEHAVETDYKPSLFGWAFTIFTHVSLFITKILDIKLFRLQNEIAGSRLDHYISAIKTADDVLFTHRLQQQIALNDRDIHDAEAALLMFMWQRHPRNKIALQAIDLSNNKISVLPYIPSVYGMTINLTGNPLTEVARFLFAAINRAQRTIINFDGTPPPRLNDRNLNEYFSVQKNLFEPRLNRVLGTLDATRSILLKKWFARNGLDLHPLVAKIMTFVLPSPKSVQASIQQMRSRGQELLDYTQPDPCETRLINKHAKSCEMSFLRSLHAQQAVAVQILLDKTTVPPKARSHHVSPS